MINCKAKKSARFALISILALCWILSGYPQIKFGGEWFSVSFPPEIQKAWADTATYYFNSYNDADSWVDTVPSEMVDGSTSTLSSDNVAGHYVHLNTNEYTSGGSGTITQVEVRAYIRNNWASGFPTRTCVISMTPYFNGSTAGSAYGPSAQQWDTAAWTSYYDITNDANGPGTWSWSDIANLDMRVTTVRPQTGQVSVYRVEIRVTYTPGGSTLTLANHTLGQVGDQFTSTSPLTDVLFRFKLTRVGTVTVTELRVNFTTASGVENDDVESGELYEDTNNNGLIDDGAAIQSYVYPASGVLTFDTDFIPSTGGTNYLVRATVSDLVVGDTTTFSLGTVDIDEVEGGVTESGSISTATHTQKISLYRSVGTNAGNLNTGGWTVTISGTTATFSNPMPNSIGVGDALQYNSGGLRVAVIHGRTSSTVYTVMDKNGGTPTAASAGTAVGVYRAYTSLADWQSQTQNSNITADNINPNKNLVSANTIMNVACYGDGVDTTAVNISGWTTEADHYIKIYTPVSLSEVGVSQRHNGKWDGSKYSIQAANVRVINIGATGTGIAGNVWIDGLQIYLSSATSAGSAGIGIDQTDAANHRISNNIIRGVTGTAANYGIYAKDAVGANYVRIWNNIIYGFNGSNGCGIYNDGDYGAAFTFYAYNNTVYGCVRGYMRNGPSAGPFVAKNNIAYNNTDNYNNAAPFDASSTNNLSGPGLDADIPPTGARNGVTVTFINPTGSPPDLRLAPSDIGAKDWGVILSSDANLAFSDDIEGLNRPFGSAWDIGADEYEFKPPASLYRSVGITGSNLNTDGRTVTISGTTATFSGSMPTKIGVGDVLTYNYGGAQLAFIHGRTSSTVFTVKDKDGGIPTPALAGTTVGVYRAYTSLANWQSQTENSNITEPVEDDVNPSKNLVSANTILNVACYGDGADTASVTIDGWTSGTLNYINIYTPYLSSEVGASQRHNGKWDDGKYRLVANVTFASGVIHVQDEYVRISGLQIENTGNKADQAKGIRVAPGSAVSEIRISHTIFRATGTGTADVATAAIYQSNTSGLVKAWNNIMYDWGSGYYMVYMTAGQCTTYPECGVTLYNNTIVNGVQRGISVSGVAAGNYRLANNLVQGASTGANYFLDMDDFIIDYSATNLSLDATKGCGSCPTAELTNKTVSFVDAANKDFRLSYADDSAQNYGTNLSSDPNLAFTDDINGHNRPFGSAWDIGADENAEAPYYRRLITLNVAQRGSSCTGSLSNFPVLIDTTNWPAADKSTLKTVSNGGHVNRSEGYDIIFRASDGVTQLDHEIEKFDGSTGTLVAWVRIPTLFENNRDTAIYMDYGNPLITSATANPAGVWNSNYVGVWHLADTSGNAKDSTSYNISGTVSGTVTRGATGQINGAFDCYTNGEVDWGDPADGHLDFGTGSFTVSAWLNIDAMVSAGAWPQPIWKGNSGTYWTGYALEYDDANNTYYFVIDDATSQFGYTSPGATFLDDTWYYIVGVVDRTNNRLRIYKNGVEVGTGTSIVGVGSVSNTSNLAIGADGGWGWFDGLIDEVRIAAVARDACWIGTEYNSQNGPGSFTTVGSEIMLGQFENRKQITLNVSQRGSSCTGSLSNFPVLINLSGDWLKTKASGGSIYNTNGYDIIFRDANNNHLDHEIEKYDGSATPGNLIVWVRIPTLFENNQDTLIYMYYGNASISSPTENPTGVWDSNYRGVWHLKESGSGSLDEYKDSSQYANHGQGGKGYPLYVPTRVAGKVNYGQDFNNSDGKYNLIDLGNDPSLDVIGKQITLEAWVQHNVSAERPYGILNHKGWNNGYSLWMQGNQYQCPSGARCVTFNLPGATDSLKTQTTLTGSTWHHVVGTYDGALMKVFIDGVQDSNTEPKTNDITAPSLPENDVWIGYGDQGMDVAWSAEWEGQIDEVRISSVARDTCWIQTQFNNQNSPSTFSTTGTGEEFEYKYRKQITILDSMTPAGCSSDLTNFPVLINLSGTWLKTVANSGNISHPYGYDIIFRAQDGETKLDHEIEKYDGSATGGTLVAWVRIPTLKFNASTIIYMYYGNPEVTSPTANKTGVWINNFREVWHLHETAGGTVADSTSSGYSGTASAGVNQNPATEKIDGADGFNGSTGLETLNDGTMTANSSFTLESWFYLNAAIPNGAYLPVPSKHREAPATNDWIGLYAVNTGTPRLMFGWGNTGGNLNGTTTLSTGQWYYAVGTYDGTTRRLYLNGSQENTDTGAQYNVNLTYASRIGNDGVNSYYLNGFVDEVRISTGARDACWIGTSYNNMNSPSTSVTVEGQEDLVFEHRKQITILNSMTPDSCTGNLTNFPVHISLSGNWLKTAPNGDIHSVNGYDIIFRAQDGVTKLDHEIEDYNGSTGTLVAWVRIPTLSYNANTIIYMYYGNSTITTSQANPTGVWDSSYKGVWHLSNDNFNDSTSNGNNGSNSGSVNATGKIAEARDFDGIDDYVSVGSAATLDNLDPVTVEAWIKAEGWGDGDGAGNYYPRILGKSSGGGSEGFRLVLRDDPVNNHTSTVEFREVRSTTEAVSIAVDNTVSIGGNYHVVGVFDSAASILKIYVNGSEVSYATYQIGSGAISDASYDLLVGNRGNMDRSFEGIIDEVRVSGVVRDACWIGTEYTNQNSPLASYTVEGEEFDYKYRKQITIKDSMTPASCSSDLTNYPVLISLSNQTWLKTKAADPVNGCIENASGYDIIFKAEDGETKLDHEIEKYDGTEGAGTLVAWVRIPTLLYNASTIIYMYYGNPTITSPTANPAAVWDTNYRGVWHLKEDPSGTAPQMKDSKNANHGTSYGSMTSGDQVAAKINGGLDLEGTDDYINAANNGSTLNVGQAFTVEAWVKRDTTGTKAVATKAYSDQYSFKLSLDGATNIVRLDVNTGAGYVNVQGDTIADSNWHYVGAYSNGTNIKVFKDGVVHANSNSTPAAIPYDSNNLWIGTGRWTSNPVDYLDGMIDEVRISNVARSACWIGTSYNNQESPLTHIDVEGVGQNLDYNYRQLITISDSMTPASCSSDLTNFPVLINLSGTWLKTVANGGNISHPYGYDIIFKDENGLAKLDHEIEDYNGSAGTLLAWVRVPTLHFNDSTNIYIYYGNSAITSPTANAAGVWNSNYKSVYHLKENPATSAIIYDSTSSAYNLDNSSRLGLQMTGQVDGAVYFDDPAHRWFGTTSANNITTEDVTISAWIKTNETTVSRGLLGKPKVGSQPYGGYGFGTQVSGGNSYLDFRWHADSYYDRSVTATTNPLNDNAWHHVVVTATRSASGPTKLYVDGNLVMTDTQSNSDTWDSSGELFHMGDANWGYTGFWYDHGMDEVRIATATRSECWIQTEYNNQNSPATYVTLGSEGVFAPTLVKLSSFKATHYPEGTLLEWKTGYEVDNLGFHIYREESGQLVRLTPEPVAGTALLAGKRTALTAGHSYFWWDASLSPHHSSLSPVRYWLKDIDLNRKQTMHGPVSPTISREPLPNKFRPELLSEIGLRLNERYHHYWKVQDLRERLALKRLEVRGAPRGHGLRSGNKVPLRIGPMGLEGRGFHRGSDPAASEIQRYLAGKPGAKLFVKEEGWYRVSQSELVAAGLSPRANPRYLQLYADGKEQPIRITGRKHGKHESWDAIEFYGVGLDTPSTDTRVYWLVESSKPGKLIHEYKSHGGRMSSGSFPYTVEKKDRTLYFAALHNGEGENFFGPIIHTKPVDQILELQHLDPAATEDALLEVVLQGSTDTPHRVKVYLNDENEEVGEIVFEGQRKGTLKVEIPQSMLEEGENLVSLVASGDEMDATLLDTIRLTYWHTYTADDNGLRLRARGGNHLTVDGFGHSNIRVFDITDSNEVIEVTGKVESQKGGYAITFRVPENGERTLLVLTEEKVKDPIEVVSNHPSAWHQEKGGYDLVIISHRDFLDSLKPLKKLRESQGYKVTLVDVEDLYDEFSFGHKSPHALRDFLSLAKKQWRKSPRFVLLVGDASFDPRNYLGLGDMDYVPTKLVDTTYMETASDDWFVDLNGDGLPEMAIGRLPVQTAKEAAIVVSKIVGYEKSSKKKEALLVADINDGFNFESASEEVRALLPAYLMVRKIFRGEFSSDAQAKGELLNGINQGVLLVNFIGHGSIEHWRGSLLTLEDAESLVNGLHLPFFVNMTCLNGFFQNPYGETLAESLLKSPGGGAVAIWASSGLTEPDNQAVMNKELIKLLFGREFLTLGEATARAKAFVSDQDIRKTWILFGDPTTKIK